jgi:hypothetical protein
MFQSPLLQRLRRNQCAEVTRTLQEQPLDGFDTRSRMERDRVRQALRPVRDGFNPRARTERDLVE